jgi:hypothetical protein
MKIVQDIHRNIISEMITITPLDTIEIVDHPIIGDPGVEPWRPQKEPRIPSPLSTVLHEKSMSGRISGALKMFCLRLKRHNTIECKEEKW